MIQPPPPNFSLAKVIYKENITDDLVIMRIKSEDTDQSPDFDAGQFVTLGMTFPGENKLIQRAYSIASPPEQKDYIELYIKLATEPMLGKMTNAIFGLTVGDHVYWKKPMGMFTIESKYLDGSPDSRRIILVASGTGLAPFISYVLHLWHTKSQREIILLHGARYSAELGYRKLLEDLESKTDNNWRFKYVPTVSRPDDKLSQNWNGFTGRVETLLASQNGKASALETIIKQRVDPQNSFFYVCGYTGTINSVVSTLTPLGFATNRDKRKDGSYEVKIESYG
jgi:ferredoxin--NADP+ reductase